MGRRVFVVGATGFIGRHLVEALLEEGYEVWALVRSPYKIMCLPEKVRPVLGEAHKPGPWQEEASKCEIGINLAGASIFHRWTEEYKRLILDSRVLSTRFLGEALVQGRGQVFFSASAIGYYGDTGEEEVDETYPPGKDFLAQVCVSWEAEALKWQSQGLRVCVGRLGIVLGPDGGALRRMLPAFKLGLGGPLGNGHQWFPWIHMKDVVSAIIFLIRHEKASGPFNIVAPEVVRQKEFVRTLGRLLRRPAVIPLSVRLLKLFFGELAEALTTSCKAQPQNLLALGFKFAYPHLEKALKDLLGYKDRRYGK